ncbi:hypothetical protein AVEN_52600-1 [Araneus ventricosus]|uniref:Ig-like domain-containing protein n=1 Tax=Araneus ventricosus TaxID=182803 RepID=A0A4Y2ES12_ARAVE|nr:hypothetical protein AVEN_52600-1 [Araneus ventricosus]
MPIDLFCINSFDTNLNYRFSVGGAYLPLNHRQKISHGGSLTVRSVERSGDEGEYGCVVRDDSRGTAAASTHVSIVGKRSICKRRYFKTTISMTTK